MDSKPVLPEPRKHQQGLVGTTGTAAGYEVAATSEGARWVRLPGENTERRLLVGADNPELRPDARLIQTVSIRAIEELPSSQVVAQETEDNESTREASEVVYRELDQSDILAIKDIFLMQVDQRKTLKDLVDLCEGFQRLLNEPFLRRDPQNFAEISALMKRKIIELLSASRRIANMSGVKEHFKAVMTAILSFNRKGWIDDDALEASYKVLLSRIARMLPNRVLDSVADLITDCVLPSLPDEVQANPKLMDNLIPILLSGWFKFLIRHMEKNTWNMNDACNFPRDEQAVVTGIFRIYQFFFHWYDPEKTPYENRQKKVDMRCKLDFLKMLSTTRVDSWYAPVRKISTTRNNIHFDLSDYICETIKNVKIAYGKGGDIVLYGSAACFSELCRIVSSFRNMKANEVLCSSLCFLLNDLDFFVSNEPVQVACMAKLVQIPDKINSVTCSQSEMSLFVPTCSGFEQLKICSVIYSHQDCTLLKININHINERLIDNYGFSGVETQRWSPFFYRDDKVFYNHRKSIMLSVLNKESLQSAILFNLANKDFSRRIVDMIHLLPLCLSEQQAGKKRWKFWQQFVRSCIDRKLI